LLKVKAKTLIVWGQDDRAGAIDVGCSCVRRLADARMHIFPAAAIGPCGIPRRIQSRSSELFSKFLIMANESLGPLGRPFQVLRCLSAKTMRRGSNERGTRSMRTALGELNRLMTSIPSPTGEEGQLARALVEVMNQSGVGAFYQPMDDDQGNAIGRITGSGGGGDLLLYAPLDTAFSPTRKKNARGSATNCRGI
jgi:hypothetical protein